MPVIEYKLHKAQKGFLETPTFVEDGGYWRNPSNHTMLGWCTAEADREYWVPDTVTELTKAEAVTRALAIHSVTPYMLEVEVDGAMEAGDAMTTEQVTNQMETWYDNFVASKG